MKWTPWVLWGELMSDEKYLSKEGRQRCWDARDFYWRCLENNNEDTGKCLNERKPYERECSKTWVKHFDRRRGYNKYKEKLESGYDPLTEPSKKY